MADTEFNSEPTGFESLSDEQVNALSMDDFVERLLAQLQGSDAQISCEDMDAIEKRWTENTRWRRCSLVMLTQSWKSLSEKVEADKDFAAAVAQLFVLRENIEFYKGIVNLLECANSWCMTALAGREDIDELIESAEREVAHE